MKKILFLALFILLTLPIFSQDCNQTYHSCQQAFSNAVNDATGRHHEHLMDCMGHMGNAGDLWDIIENYAETSNPARGPVGQAGAALWTSMTMLETAMEMWNCIGNAEGNFGNELNNYDQLRCACFGACGGC